MIFIGTAGWNIPARHAADFPKAGTHLVRYGARMTAVEINSSFYRPHQARTYARWAAGVPPHFRFAVKLPRSITHHGRLKDYDDALARFRGETAGLGEKLGVMLVQLPPSLAFDAKIAGAFFHDLAQAGVPVACEPRHASWFMPQADALLAELRIARVAADPPRDPADGRPGGWTGLRYWRLHGSPKIYYSEYDRAALEALAPRLHDGDWCIFDNTAASAALDDALCLKALTDA